VRECCSVEETAEWRTLNRIETATLNRLYKKPATDLATRRQEVSIIREPMLQFERRMRARYPSMPLTLNEQEQQWLNDPEIQKEVQQSVEDEKLLKRTQRRC
jgi:TfoX/Sxy family transcriptional regulator of competence genes